MNHVTNISAHRDYGPKPVYHLTCTCGLSRWCHLTKADTQASAREHKRSNA